ncbi:MAG: 2-C-methyl-D-erythritol 4-phosphate cytidylyltransferase, partial [Planctomycetes bacterium]|nr:2-C-methyl-D-erythritol 4-phosphate cytidylyltransferase [Planctomycetota bacterium]
MYAVAIVPAAGRGERMGADKALLGLGGLTAYTSAPADLAERQQALDAVLAAERRGVGILTIG